MSHFTEMEVNFDQSQEASLIQALESVFGKGSVEVHEIPSGLYGYGGDLRSKLSKSNKNYAPPCHLIVRRRNVGDASNDVGYRRNEEGGYSAYISRFDKNRNFNKHRQNTVAQEYAAGVASKNLKAQGYLIKRTVNNGKIYLTATKYKS